MAKSFIELVDELSKGREGIYDTLMMCFSEKKDLEGKAVSVDFLKQVIDELESYVRKGNTHCMALLGNIYLNGWCVDEDLHKALDYARRAASLGDAGGEVLLGYLYANGQGVAKNYDRALYWFRMSLEKGHSMAANNLGVMYENGLGVKKDLNMAIKYYQQAASQQNKLAEKNLDRLAVKRS
jgi:TPR repeat protein